MSQNVAVMQCFLAAKMHKGKEGEQMATTVKSDKLSKASREKQKLERAEEQVREESWICTSIPTTALDWMINHNRY